MQCTRTQSLSDIRMEAAWHRMHCIELDRFPGMPPPAQPHIQLQLAGSVYISIYIYSKGDRQRENDSYTCKRSGFVCSSMSVMSLFGHCDSIMCSVWV